MYSLHLDTSEALGRHLWLENQYFTMCFTTRTTQKQVSGMCRLWGWDERRRGGRPAAARGPGRLLSELLRKVGN